MKHIVFYISSHGYGHLTRCLAVIGALLEKNQGNDSEAEKGQEKVCITMKCSPDHVDFAFAYFHEIGISEKNLAESLSIDSMRTDIGTLVVPGSMEIDIEASLKQAEEYYAGFAARVEAEKAFFAEPSENNPFGKPHLIVGDIVPWSFLLADALQVPSLAISNFTWLDTCKHFLPEAIYQGYLAAYRKATLCLAYELSMPSMQDAFTRSKQISLTMRKVDLSEVEELRRHYLEEEIKKGHLAVNAKSPAESELKLVYISIGGLVGLSETIDVTGLPYTFIATAGVNMKGDNVYKLPKQAHTQNYMMAADFCITKPGWSTTAEALLCQKPLGLIDRPDSYEDRSTMNYLLGRHQAVKLNQSDLTDMAKVMAELERLKTEYPNRFHPKKGYAYQNDLDRIIEEIRNLIMAS